MAESKAKTTRKRTTKPKGPFKTSTFLIDLSNGVTNAWHKKEQEYSKDGFLSGSYVGWAPAQNPPKVTSSASGKTVYRQFYLQNHTAYSSEHGVYTEGTVRMLKPSDSAHFYDKNGTWKYDPVRDELVVAMPVEVEVENDPASFKWTPPPSKWDDTEETKKRHQKHSAALRKVLDGFLVGSESAAIQILELLNPSGYGISVNLYNGDDLTSQLPDNFEKAKEIAGYVKDFDSEERKAILRHVAHVFSIPKGNTWVR